MGFRRTANAIVSHPNIEFDRWMDELRAQHQSAAQEKQVMRVAKTVLRKCDPSQYLLSHATIVASVDCYAPKDAAVGRFLNRDVECVRKFSNFRVKPECESIINNNGDAWERSLLLATYRTFIGAPNYLEHIQIPELSKGFIVDAIARDLGETCYVDILVATDRKHKILISDILSENIRAMSMGCISLFTICNKCGNVAVDDTQLCPCILYDGKGSKFVDESGVEHRLSELIGHVSVPNSNQFIEASWVRNPAFGGAQRRNILNPNSPSVLASVDQAASVYELRRDEIHLDGALRAASRVAQEDEAPADDISVEDEISALEAGADEGGDAPADEEPSADDAAEDAPAEDAPADEKPSADKIQELMDKASELLMENLVQGIAEKMAPKPEDVATATPGLSDANHNDTLIGSFRSFDKALLARFPGSPKLVRWASRAYRIVHGGGVRGVRQAAMTPRDLIVLSWIEDTVRGRPYPASLYKLAMTVGPVSLYPSEASFLAACRIKAGKELSSSEKKFLSWKGRIASVSTNF